MCLDIHEQLPSLVAVGLYDGTCACVCVCVCVCMYIHTLTVHCMRLFSVIVCYVSSATCDRHVTVM